MSAKPLYIVLVDGNVCPFEDGRPVSTSTKVPKRMVEKALKRGLVVGDCENFSLTTGTLWTTEMNEEQLMSKKGVVSYAKMFTWYYGL